VAWLANLGNRIAKKIKLMQTLPIVAIQILNDIKFTTTDTSKNPTMICLFQNKS